MPEALKRKTQDASFSFDHGYDGGVGAVADPLITTADRSAERIANETRERNAYREFLGDVVFLRQRGFTVFLDGQDEDGNPSLVCDGKPITATRLRELAARERRLLGH